MMVLMDFELESPVGYIEPAFREELQQHWTPNPDSASHEFIACVGDEKKKFAYNPHDEEDARVVMEHAIEWVHSKVGPAVKLIPMWLMAIKALMFWKYEIIHEGFHIIGLKPRDEEMQL